MRGLRMQSCSTRCTGTWVRTTTPRPLTGSRRVNRYNNWGDCHGYFLVATGGADIMTDPIMNLWDLMALVPTIEGAAGASPTGTATTQWAARHRRHRRLDPRRRHHCANPGNNGEPQMDTDEHR
ncbi:MAG: hypothetical protein R2838_21530 [Caldilineaceae bacterium]